MRRKFIVIIVMVFVLVLAACTSKAPAATQVPEPTATSAPEPTATSAPEEPQVEATAEEQPAATEEQPAAVEGSAETASGEVREIQVTAKLPKFTPNDFTIKKGETVRFVVTAEDIFHTFTVKKDPSATELLTNLSLTPNQEPAVWEWTPAETGDYYLYCRPHEGRGMVGVIRVVE